MSERLKFAEALKRNRIKNNKTQRECAVACDVCLEGYQKWERGLSYPKEENLEKICNFLNIEASDYEN